MKNEDLTFKSTTVRYPSMSDSENKIFEGDDEQLHALYSQLSEEAQYRHKLIHNSYYLTIIMFGVFGGATLRYLESSLWKAGFSVLGFGFVVIFLSGVIYVNNSRRTAAYKYRRRLEKQVGTNIFDISQQVNELQIRNSTDDTTDSCFSERIHDIITGQNVKNISFALAGFGVICCLLGFAVISYHIVS